MEMIAGIATAKNNMVLYDAFKEAHENPCSLEIATYVASAVVGMVSSNESGRRGRPPKPKFLRKSSKEDMNKAKEATKGRGKKAKSMDKSNSHDLATFKKVVLHLNRDGYGPSELFQDVGMPKRKMSSGRPKKAKQAKYKEDDTKKTKPKRSRQCPRPKKTTGLLMDIS
jgi:hypothetical protein